VSPSSNAGGTLSTVVVISAACRAEISPAACAAAVGGCNGSKISPTRLCRGARFAAARTRARASTAEMRSSCDTNTAVDAHPCEYANPRRPTSPINR
jgi:hypothetical protein